MEHFSGCDDDEEPDCHALQGGPKVLPSVLWRGRQPLERHQHARVLPVVLDEQIALAILHVSVFDLPQGLKSCCPIDLLRVDA